MPVTLMVRSSRKAKWREHGVYATRDEAWAAITAIVGHTTSVRIVEAVAPSVPAETGIPVSPGSTRTPTPPATDGW